MSPDRTIGALRRLAGIGLTVPNDPDVQVLSAALIAFTEGDGPASLDDALGLSVQRGEPSWQMARARSERNRMLRLAALAFHPKETPSQAARLLAATWREYWCGGWQTDKRAVACPAHVTGTPTEPFWRIMKIWPGAPLSAKQIAEVLRSAETIAFEYSTRAQKS